MLDHYPSASVKAGTDWSEFEPAHILRALT